MKWPFVSRTVHEIEVRWRDAAIAVLTTENTELRRRLDLLVDQALARAGAINQPTMRDVKVPPAAGPAAMLAGAMGITEIESKRPEGPKGPPRP